MPSVMQNTRRAIWRPLPIGSTGASGSTRSRRACSWSLPLSAPAQALGFGLLKYLANQDRLGKTDVLLLDVWGLAKLTAEQRRDLLEILEDRHGSRSTIVTSQLPLDQWHASIGDSTLADAIMDRLVHNAYKIKLEGDSLRKQQADLTTTN
jgi:hypothetical protein